MQNIKMLRSFIPISNFSIKPSLPILCPTLKLVQDFKPEYNAVLKHRGIYTSSIKYTEKNDEGVLKRILKKMGWMDISRTRRKVTSYLMYESVADKIDYEYFFKVCKMPDTFNSWFLITELHVWMLLVRAMAEGCEKGSIGREMRNDIVEALWADVATRTKQFRNVNSRGVREQIQILSQQFQYALIGYDEALGSNDMVLAAAIWRRFFEQRYVDPEVVEKLVLYVRKQLALFDKIKSEEFVEKRDLEWIALDGIS